MEDFFRLATAFFLIGGFATSGYFRIRAQIKGGKLRSKEGTRPLALMRLVGLALWVPIIAYGSHAHLMVAIRYKSDAVITAF